MNIRLWFSVLVIGAVVQSATLGAPTFTLTGSDSLAVTSAYDDGLLYDTSSADIQSGGSVAQLTAHDDSSVTLSGGSVNKLTSNDNSNVLLVSGSITLLTANNFSDITVLDGAIGEISLYDSSNMQISDGTIGDIFATDASTLSISGGTMAGYFTAVGSSSTTFYGSDWSFAGSGLSIVGDELSGSGWGTLSGLWEDGTGWSIDLYKSGTATITLATTPAAVPVPSAFLLAGFGTLLVGVLRRRREQQ